MSCVLITYPRMKGTQQNKINITILGAITYKPIKNYFFLFKTLIVLLLVLGAVRLAVDDDEVATLLSSINVSSSF